MQRVTNPLRPVSQTKLPNGDTLIIYEEINLKQVIAIVLDKNDKTVAVSVSEKQHNNFSRFR